MTVAGSVPVTHEDSTRSTPCGAQPSWVRPFSEPSVPLDERYASAIVVSSAVALVSRLLDTNHEALVSGSRGLIELLEAWAAEPTGYETAWDLAFGRLELLVQGGRLDPLEVAARLGLRLTETGATASWEVDLSRLSYSVPLRLGDRLVLAAGVRSDRGSVRFTTAAGALLTIAWDASARRWTADEGERLPVLAAESSTIALLHRGALPGMGERGQGFDDVWPATTIHPAVPGALKLGLEVLARSAPEHWRWVQGVLRQVVVCEREQQFRVVSGSGEHAPGVIHLSYPLTTWDIAEIAVHESAHQYFYMLGRLGPVDDGTDLRTYYSPPIRKERPLSRILMAYHALANVRLLYDDLRRGEPEAHDYLDANEADLIDAVVELDGPLRDNPALNELGRGLYEPLAARLEPLRS